MIHTISTLIAFLVPVTEERDTSHGFESYKHRILGSKTLFMLDRVSAVVGGSPSPYDGVWDVARIM